MASECGDIDVQTRAAGKSHFRKRHQQPAVRTIVISEQVAGFVQELDRAKKFDQKRRVVAVSWRPAGMSVTLREHRLSQPVSACAEVEEQQDSTVLVTKLWRQAEVDIDDWREGRGNERDRGHALPGSIGHPPGGLHRHRVFANGNVDSECGAEVHANRLYRVKEPRVLARKAGGTHPVCR